MQEDKANILLEPFFLLAFHLGIDWNTYYHWPVAYKRWMIDRLQKEMDKRTESNDIPSKASYYNVPEARAMTGKQRYNETPSRLRRFK